MERIRYFLFQYPVGLIVLGAVILWIGGFRFRDDLAVVVMTALIVLAAWRNRGSEWRR